MGQQSLASGSTIYVDAEASGANNGTSWADAFSDLQTALDAVQAGQQIWVAAGTYWPTHLLSPSDPRSATFQLKNGVAIYGGFDPSFGDVAFEDRDWEANSSILSGDLLGDDGPGFENNEENGYHVFYHPEGTDLDSSAILDGFTISGGNADGDDPHNRGGGMYNDESSPTLTNCILSSNSADWGGGGMYNDESSPTLTSCILSSNSTDASGGGMLNRLGSSPTLTNCVFDGNSADWSGGGMLNWNGSSPVLINCIFSGNSAVYRGGGIYNEADSSLVLTNCIFSRNSAQNTGGGIHNTVNSSASLTNCTFSGNSASWGGGALSNVSGSSAALDNCILWGDTSPEVFNSEGTLIITYSNVQGGYQGEGNISADPLYFDLKNGDYHLLPGSPCIDAGSGDAPGLPSDDFEGDSRMLDGDGDGVALVDMGVDEKHVHYIDADAMGADDGSSWEDAYIELQDALEAAGTRDALWVAEGIYRPTSGTDRTASFQMKQGVALYGGFDPSFGACGFEDRDWVLHETILSGDLNGDDGPDSANNGENSYHVFYHGEGTDLDGSAILDGFTISGGNAVGDDPHNYGGGMFNNGSSPALTNCILAGNWAGNGGGMANINGSAPTLSNCAFSSNSAIALGGGMYNLYSSPALANCTFSGNSADADGGGMVNSGNSSPTLTNCTFSGNLASNYGGGIFNNDDSSPVLTNCVLWGDTPHEIYAQVSLPEVTYSDIQGGYAGEGNIDADPLFFDAVSGDFHLGPGSPCIDAGIDTAANLPEHDVDGDDRIMDGDHDGTPTVDMGVDEVRVASPPAVIFVDMEATGDHVGTSWEDAYTDLQDALDWAEDGVEIWVAEGIYTPTQELSPGDPRSATFQMKNGVALYGGFDPSLGDIGFEDRESAANVTILSGDLNCDDGSDFANNGENSYHVFCHPEGTDLNGSALLDGFTITGGNANGDGFPDDRGAGMFNYGSSPTLTNCTISRNSASWGGGMYNIVSSPTLSNCIFLGNSAVEYVGGGMLNNNSSPSLTNCTFWGNSADRGGGMSLAFDAFPVLTNCILWGNSPDEIYDLYMGSSPEVTYSDIQGGYAGEGNINADPMFLDAASGDLHLGPDSPCIDAGNNDAPNLPEYDFEGDERVLDGDGNVTVIVDMGADEVAADWIYFRVCLPVVLRNY